MQIRHDKEFPFGYTPVTELKGHHAETLMDFGILRLQEGATHHFAAGKERAILLLSGALDISADGVKTRISRRSIFDQAPWCLHLSSEGEAAVTAAGGEAEITAIA